MFRRGFATPAVLVLTITSALLALGGYAYATRPPAVEVDTALAFSDHGVELVGVSAAPGDSQMVVARWGAASNALGPADAYRIRWSFLNGPASVVRFTTLLQDSFAVPLPALGDSVGVRVSVWARRREKQSLDSVTAIRYFQRVDAPPPPPGPVILDTTAYTPDSIRIFVAKGALKFNDGVGFIPGTDTTLVCGLAHSRQTNTWHLGEYGAVVQGVGADSLSLFDLVRFPAAQCANLIASRNGPPVSPGYYTIQWQVTGSGTPPPNESAFGSPRALLGARFGAT